jgi:diguanylate cyclase (GGDEF)-like protein
VQEIEKQKLEIEQLANTDSVTGFCAARLAMPMLTQAISLAQREQSKVGVVFIDLNNFKAINDNFGHDAGDFVLQETANRIRNVLRGMDTSCRIGGDEFLFIIPKINDVSEIHMILQRVIATWAEPVSFENAKLKVTGSIGVAMYPDDSDCPQELRKKADAAMYYAKDNGLALKFFS